MDVWIETAAGNLVRSATLAIVIRPGESGNGWEVCISASAPPSVFAAGFGSREEARLIRNALAVAISGAKACEGTPAVFFDRETLTVKTEDLAG
ncbi:hypothetical protein [Arthrobacter caoxuetaonis]|uniref:Uncharacterized protein n=1 Tax=Arthrobacter caoxuetaonis TaxID=2886935 RepID=A0A9X1MHQ8_9MICC|nr:hypothetical protein [Arthrobacter caoxuetaonis]MCC3299465.1 hypothetical protein [Arthrobacter caoxuetaonis]USQ59043.1 hypothetical protein NF551_18225 [Arthrobacter caoxuetaonis]